MSSSLTRELQVGLRSEWEELTYTELTSGNTSNGSVAPSAIGTAVRLIKTKQMSKVFYIDNSTNQPLALAIVAPDDTTKTRVKWLILNGGRIVNFELASNNLLIEAGTEVWVYTTGTAPTSGNLSMFSWG